MILSSSSHDGSPGAGMLAALVSCMMAVTASGDTPLGLGPARDVEVTRHGNGEIGISITGGTPHFWSEPVLPPGDQTVLAFDYFSTSGVPSLSVRFRDGSGEMVLVNAAPLPVAETWQPFALDLPVLPDAETRFHFSLKGKSASAFRLRRFRLREPSPAEIEARENRSRLAAERERDAAAFQVYLREKYFSSIESVVIEKNRIRISGKATGALRLVEIPPHLPSHAGSPLPPIPLDEGGTFRIDVPRIDSGTGRDRVSSRWRLESGNGAIASLARWPTRIHPDATGKVPPLPEAPGPKGIGGVPDIARDDHPLFELGVHHATVNIVVDALLSPVKRAGRTPWNFEGTTYYLNDRFLAAREETVRRLCERGVIVTGILLVGNGESSWLKHPEAEPRGTFAMPDLATPHGTRHYRAALALLAERFARPENRISNWIIHNEVDQHGTWTNMGDQPLARYLETYARSARLVYFSTRLRDPHARVFISLTHHWTKPSIGKGAFVVRELVDLWRELARAEGDFDWGVAYHPYPRNLRNPDTWDDTGVTFDFDTPYITPKNIEVLPAYLGPERPILLSEQGFNTPTLSVADQMRQVAGLIYLFRKLPELPTIEAFHLHRYQDMPDREGGLRLGILDEHGNRKLGWDTYAALGTGKEIPHASAAAELIPEPAPVRDVASGRTPNIVLVVADDLGWSDITPNQDPNENFYETPAIAGLADRGMRFTNAYSASPLCSPTRASILTGQYPGRLRLTTPAAHLPKVVLDPGVPESAGPTRFAVEPGTRTRFPNHYVTIAERLGERRYATAFVGKWHLGHPPYIPDNQGFDFVVGGRHHPGPPGGFFAPWTSDMIPEAPEGSHIDDVITGEAIGWLEGQVAARQPFFLNLWYYSVHAPLEAKADLIEKYRIKAGHLPPGSPRGNPVMAAMIETLDTNIGRIGAALDRLDVAEDTLFIFTSDNGGNEYNFVEGLPATNNHPLRNGKGNISEGGQRVPFIAVWPGRIAPGSTNSGLVSSIDLFPTILDAARLSPVPGQPVDGLSLLPVFLGESQIDPGRALFCHFPHSPPATGAIGGTSVRRGPWKLTRFYADGPGQSDRLRLVNLETDPGEKKDLSTARPELAATMNRLISGHLADTRSLVSRPNPRYLPSFLGWMANRNVELSRIDDALSLHATGADPSIVTTDFPRSTGSLTFEIEMEGGASGDPPVLYWATRSEGRYHRDRSRPLEETAPGRFRVDLELGDDSLRSLRLDPSRNPGRFVIHSIRLIQWKGTGAGKSQRLWDF